MTFEVESLKDWQKPAKWLLEQYPNGGVFFLRGRLAVGKTTFVKAIVSELGYNNAYSPTFALINSYGDNIFHYDLYQLQEKNISLAEVVQNFLEPGWHFIEWADENTEKIVSFYGITPVWNDICVKGEKRHIKIE
ncbi:MAG: hypothetical protein RL154_187 [Pseudomonadota bacterium]|jgi:tRNA threonylcarbamoyladenosine biosynthesis protein TsaE